MRDSGKDDEKKEGSWRKTLVLALILALIFLDLPVCASQEHHHHHQHDHDHDHHHHHHDSKPASFKYSREANEEHHHNHHQDDGETKPHWRPVSDYQNVKGDVFIQAMGSTLLISAAPFLMLFLIPLDNTKQHEPFLKVLLSFASGGLLGDAFLHLIPHALPHEQHHHGHAHDHEKGHSHNMSVGLCVLAGIIVFLLVEKTVRLIKGDDAHHHHHEHSNGDKDDDASKSTENERPAEGIKVAGYLNLAADCLHNFTDGLAIGASYLAGNSVGYVTTFTILLHEVPHEIGDFAMLIQSGCSKPKAIMLQLVTAVGALLGTYISLLVGGASDLATKWILPFTAGGFIYIATVSVIPELLSDTKFWQSVKEIIAILVGVYMMVLVAEYE